jgi:uroporphyrin-III C-methyltransferase/precorrin-2 dehydrogenase/sirohydrochlorin ferrochelatase
LRQRLEALLPTKLGELANALYAARAALKLRYPDGRTRRQAIGAALTHGGALDPLASHSDTAVVAWLTSETDQVPDKIFPLTLRSDDPDDLTLREARLLSQADCVCHTADVPEAILARARADAVRILCQAQPKCCTHGLCVFLSLHT